MKSNRLLAAPVSAVLLLVQASAFAQPAPQLNPLPKPPQLAPLDNANWRAIAVKNVPPSLLAWQLDPKNNAMPAFFNVPPAPQSRNNTGKSFAEILNTEPLGLPGIERLAASDEQKLLFVAGGNAQQIEKFQQLVASFDQPARIVEIEAQLVELPASTVKEFGLASDAATPGALQIGFVPNDFQSRINDLANRRAAKVVSTQPREFINNTGQAISLRNGPIDNTGANQNKPFVAPAEGTDTILTLTPTINGDETITILINTAILPVSGESSDLTTIANLRDGQTIALTGLNSSAFPRLTTQKVPLLNDIPLMNSTTPSSIAELNQIPINGKLFRSKKIEDERAVLLLVTARVVRADEK